MGFTEPILPFGSGDRVRYAVARALVPALEHCAPADSQENRRIIDEFFSSQPWTKRFGLHLVFLVFELAPWIVVGKFSRFSRLSDDFREEYYSRWATSRVYLLRQLAMLVKTVGLLGWSGQAETRNKITNGNDKVTKVGPR